MSHRVAAGKRRLFSALLAVGLAAAATGCGAAATGSSGDRHTVKVGYIVPLTGIYAANGQNEENGFKLGLDDFAGAGHTVDGSKIQVKFVDSQFDPTVGLTQARALVQNYGANIIEGPLGANVIGAVTGYLGPQGIPTDDLTLCSAVQITDYQKYHSGMDSGWSCDMPPIAGGPYVAKRYKRVAVIGMDYAFGWLGVGGFMKSFEQSGGQVVKTTWVPNDATDYSSYVSQIPRNVDAVWALFAGSAAVRFTEAYSKFGLKGRIPLIGNTTVTDYSVLPSESPSAVMGVRTDSQYCDGIQNPLNKKFTTEYHARYHTYPGYYSEAGYTKAEILVAALKRLHGDATDHKKVIAAMKATKIQAPRGPVKLNETYSSVIENAYICQVKKVRGQLRNVPIETITNQQPWSALSESTWLAHFKHDSAGRPS